LELGDVFNMPLNEASVRKNSDEAVERLNPTYLPLLRRLFILKIWGSSYQHGVGMLDLANTLKSPFPLPHFVRVGTSGLIVRRDKDEPGQYQHEYMRCSPMFYKKPMYNTVEVSFLLLFNALPKCIK
jgi:hypothetical protein